MRTGVFGESDIITPLVLFLLFVYCAHWTNYAVCHTAQYTRSWPWIL